MYAVFDTYANKLDADQHGHLKVYATEKAARRRAQDFNRSVYPKLDRMAVIKVDVRPEIVWGKPNFTLFKGTLKCIFTLLFFTTTTRPTTKFF